MTINTFPIQTIDAATIVTQIETAKTDTQAARDAPLQTLLADSFTAQDRAEFGLYLVDVTAPEGQRWTKAFAEVEGVPVAVFEPIPVDQIHAAINAERLRRIDAGSAFAVAGITEPIQLRGRPFDQTVYLALLTRASGYKAAGVTDPILTIRSADDVIYSLTPDQMISLVAQSMGWFESVMATSWAMKDSTGAFPNGIPTDFTNDTYWP